MSRVDWVPGWYDHVDHAVDKFMEKMAKDVYHTMMMKVPVRTGHLKEDLDWEYSKATKTARVGAVSVPYAIYVEEGTKRHEITPNPPKLALWWEGAAHPVYKVNHPGATATHFMKESLYMERRA